MRGKRKNPHSVCRKRVFPAGYNTNTRPVRPIPLGLCQRVLANCTNGKVRSTTRANLCFLYDGIGEHEKAIDLARTLPHVWESREILLPELLGGQARIDALRQSASVIIALLSERIDALDSPKGSESKVEKMITLGPRATHNAPKNVAQMMEKILGFLS